MLKVWIAGASGQIGRALNDVLDPMQIEALNTDLDELDIQILMKSSISVQSTARCHHQLYWYHRHR